MKRLLAVAAFLCAGASCALAGFFAHTSDQNTGSFSAYVSVPSAATCLQYGAAYGPDISFIVNSGPLGSYTRYPGNPLNIQGAIGAGNYSVFQYISYSGYSGTVINW